MSGFGGIVRFNGGPADTRTLERLGRALRVPGNAEPRVWHGGPAAFCHRAFAYTPEDRLDCQPMTMRRGGSVFLAAGRIDNRAELAGALGMATGELDRTGDAALMRCAWERWGQAGLPRLLGDFAFACWDGEAHRLVLARDAMGAVPLFYHHSAHFIAFATDYPGLLAVPEVPRDLDEIALGHFLILNHSQAERTFYAGISRVPSGGCAIFENGRPRVDEYWKPSFGKARHNIDPTEAIEEARRLLDAAVAARLRSIEPVAAQASGGLDSSGVAATAARLLAPARLHTLTLLPPEGLEVVPLRGHYPDEHDKVVALGQRIPNLDVEFLAPATPHPNETDPRRMFALTGVPVFNPINYGWFAHLYDRAAAAGHRVLLTGADGNFTLSWAGNLAIIEWLKAFRPDKAVAELRALARRRGVPIRRVLPRALLDFLQPAAVYRRRDARSRSERFGWELYSLVSPEFASDIGLQQQALAMGHDTSLRLPTDGQLARARRVLRYNEEAREFAACCPALHGIQLRHPLRDRRLVEFTLGLPETIFLRDGQRRWFARRVLSDRLPAEIVGEMRPGTQSPDWFERLTGRRTELAEEAARLSDCTPAARVIDMPRLRGAIEKWPHEATPEARPKAIDGIRLDRALHVGRFIRWAEGGNE